MEGIVDLINRLINLDCNAFGFSLKPLYIVIIAFVLFIFRIMFRRNN